MIGELRMLVQVRLICLILVFQGFELIRSAYPASQVPINQPSLLI